MIRLKRSGLIFLHLPKTGGTYIRAVLEALEIPIEVSTPKHGDVEAVYRTWLKPGDRLLGFTWIRHPLTWYRSFWLDRVQSGWGGELKIGHSCADYSFPGFVRKVLEYQSDFLSDTLRRYTESDRHDVRMRVYNYPDLLGSLLHVLGQNGETYDVDKLKEIPKPINTASIPLLETAQWPSDLAAQMCIAERELIQRFKL